MLSRRTRLCRRGSLAYLLAAFAFSRYHDTAFRAGKEATDIQDLGPLSPEQFSG